MNSKKVGIVVTGGAVSTQLLLDSSTVEAPLPERVMRISSTW
jgi:hypothetical protein